MDLIYTLTYWAFKIGGLHGLSRNNPYLSAADSHCDYKRAARSKG